MKNKKNYSGNLKNFKKYIIYFLILFVSTVLLGVGMMRDNQRQQKQKKISEAFNNKQYDKTLRTEANTKALQVYDGLILSTFGDSITGQAQWQPLLVSELGFSMYNNYGVAGARVSGNFNNAMWQDSRINKIQKESNIILFMGGTNDWSQNVPLGTLHNNDTNTFYGALNVVYDKLVSRFPNAKIIFMSTTFATSPNRNTFQNKIGLVNNLGLMNIDYGNAIGDVAKARKIPFINLTSIGWNKDNIAKYVACDVGFYVHPNATGGKKMADVIVNRLREIKSMNKSK